MHSRKFGMIIAAVVFLGAVLAADAALHASPTDEAAVRAAVLAQQSTWNRHDAKAYAALFADNADVVNVEGWWWKSRAELGRKLGSAFDFVFSESTLTITQVDFRFLTPEVAVAHARWTLAGARLPQGLAAPRQGLQTLVLQKHDGKWLIAAFQNTISVPERPFPQQ